MMVVLAYDVVADRRRTRFFKRLHAHLHPVQKSVFEGHADPRTLQAVEKLVERELNLEVDAVRIYSLCRACAGLTLTFGPGPDIFDPHAPIIP